jgi:hypothetical protein
MKNGLIETRFLPNQASRATNATQDYREG